MKLHEIQRLQKLAGIINEITVTNPMNIEVGDYVRFKDPDSSDAHFIIHVLNFFQDNGYTVDDIFLVLAKVKTDYFNNNKPSVFLCDSKGNIIDYILPQYLFVATGDRREFDENQYINDWQYLKDFESLKNQRNYPLNEIKVNNPSDFNLEDAFNKSPQSHSYNDVLEIIKSYGWEDILLDFEATFPEDEDVDKQEYINFVSSYIDDLTEKGFYEANWISISDPDVFEKAKLI